MFAYVGRNQNLKDIKEELIREVFLVIQIRNLEYGGRRCGFHTKHQSTKGQTTIWVDSHTGVSVALLGAPPFDTTMGRVEADLGSWCA